MIDTSKISEKIRLSTIKYLDVLISSKKKKKNAKRDSQIAEVIRINPDSMDQPKKKFENFPNGYIYWYMQIIKIKLKRQPK